MISNSDERKRIEAKNRIMNTPDPPPIKTQGLDKVVIGIDIGQAVDYTAIAIIKKKYTSNPAIFDYFCVDLHRIPLGTAFTDIAEIVRALCKQYPKSQVAADKTGVGAPVVELMNKRMWGENWVVGYTITGGHRRHGHRVPKTELISNLQVMAQSGELKINPNLQLAETLHKELQHYRIKINANMNEVFDPREGAHDDIVLALALAAYHAKKG